MKKEPLVIVGHRLRVKGVVQGVGFRPYVYRLAQRFGLSGGVKNTGDGVLIEIFGPWERLLAFQKALLKELPPLAHIKALSVSPLQGKPPPAFVVFESTGGSKETYLPPDVATCDLCLAELFDPRDRRYRYPFINCTDCGPRYTVIEDLPYDRERTSMKVFPLCPECHREYVDPANRRFHAEPNACPVCGPLLWITDARGEKISTQDPIRFIIERLREGKICAIKGLGGFHLAVDATNEEAVSCLRTRKHRPAKPLAVMVADLEKAALLAHIQPEEAQLLRSFRRPIVLLKKRKPFPLAPSVAPGIDLIGIMLPYTPLHHLILKEGDFLALIMTSGNTSGQPLCYRNQEALARLSGIADFFLLHNRDIVIGVDDSVTRVIANTGRVFRRARGFVPQPLPLPRKVPATLATGPLLKNTFTLTRNQEAFVSQHIGDLEDLNTLDFFETVYNHLKRLLDFAPQVIACDLHPEFLSTQWAEERAREYGCPVVRVQHHVAHALATLGERRLSLPSLALVLDGLGYGEDGYIWGGEAFFLDSSGVRRIAHLRYVGQPGGDAAAREPWRMALSYLWEILGAQTLDLARELFQDIDEKTLIVVSQMLNKRLNTPLTSSTGRLFDAVSALLGLCLQNRYEGEAAMKLETLAQSSSTPRLYPLPLKQDQDKAIWDTSALWQALVEDLSRHPKEDLAAGFHLSLARGLAQGLKHLAQIHGTTQVVLSGGCFQNAYFSALFLKEAQALGLQAHLPVNIPVNDGGVSYGQAVWVALYGANSAQRS